MNIHHGQVPTPKELFEYCQTEAKIRFMRLLKEVNDVKEFDTKQLTQEDIRQQNKERNLGYKLDGKNTITRAFNRQNPPIKHCGKTEEGEYLYWLSQVQRVYPLIS